MGFFRRGESLNQRLLREAELDTTQDAERDQPESLDPILSAREQFGSGAGSLMGIRLSERARRWDVVVTTEAPGLEGNEVDFVTLPDGSILVEQEQGDAALDPLAQAIEAELVPPYRAHAVRKTDELWAVSAVRVEVERFEANGNVIELTRTGDGTTLRVDGMPTFGSIRELELLAEQIAGPEYAAHAERLDADLWEVQVAPL